MKAVVLTGEVKLLQPNEKGGLSVRVRSVHGDGRAANLEFFDIYGNYANILKEKEIIKVGDIVSVEYEEKEVQKVDPATGKPDKWVRFKENVHFRRTYRPTQSDRQHQQNAVEETETGLDYDTF